MDPSSRTVWDHWLQMNPQGGSDTGVGPAGASASFSSQFDFPVPQEGELPHQSTSALPPLPPLPDPLPGRRSTRQAKAAATSQAVSSGTAANNDEDDGENSGDYEEDLDDFQAEDDIIYDFQPFDSIGPDGQPMIHAGSLSPNGTSIATGNGKGRGRKPKTVVAAGVPKDSPDYQRLRKENHKNVEKKRREHINDGIKRLSSLVPGADKNKSKIINQAADYIAALKQNEANNLEKWTLDKLMTDKAIRDLQGEADRLRQELDRRDKQLQELSMRLR